MVRVHPWSFFTLENDVVVWKHSIRANNCIMEQLARLAQSVERKALNLVVVGSSPTVGVFDEKKYIIIFLCIP